MAFVVVTHAPVARVRLMPELLSRYCGVPFRLPVRPASRPTSNHMVRAILRNALARPQGDTNIPVGGMTKNRPADTV
jgi:hypothetical protein